MQMNAGLICNHYKLSNCRKWPDIFPGKLAGWISTKTRPNEEVQSGFGQNNHKTIFFCKKIFVSTCLHCFNAATSLAVTKGTII